MATCEIMHFIGEKARGLLVEWVCTMYIAFYEKVWKLWIPWKALVYLRRRRCVIIGCIIGRVFLEHSVGEIVWTFYWGEGYEVWKGLEDKREIFAPVLGPVADKSRIGNIRGRKSRNLTSFVMDLWRHLLIFTPPLPSWLFLQQVDFWKFFVW